jgi:hypothetical protein
MAEETSEAGAEQPVKRRPGRPRKNPAPPAKSPATPDTVAAEVEPVEVAKAAAEDERIGAEVHPLATAVGFDDGSTYRCEDGKIVERLT